jgi:Tol biopolymer transport system component
LVTTVVEGSYPDGEVKGHSISADGRFVAFQTDATNLVANDTNGLSDIFLVDRWKGTTRRISIGPDGVQSDGASENPKISANGRYVVYDSLAENLTTGPGNASEDVFLYDRHTDTTRVISDGGGVNGNPSISADGSWIAYFTSNDGLDPLDNNGRWDVYLYELATKEHTLVSMTPGGGNLAAGASSPSISADGQRVAWVASGDDASPLDNNGALDVYVYDQATGTSKLVSRSEAGVIGNDDSAEPAISGDGTYVAFWSEASNLVAGDNNGVGDVFLAEVDTGQIVCCSRNPGGEFANARSWWVVSTSNDGTYVAFSSQADNLTVEDTNNGGDAFLYNRRTGQIEVIGYDSTGQQMVRGSGRPIVSRWGDHVVFYSYHGVEAAGVNNLFVRSFQTTQELTGRGVVSYTGQGGQDVLVILRGGSGTLYTSDRGGGSGVMIDDSSARTVLRIVSRGPAEALHTIEATGPMRVVRGNVDVTGSLKLDGGVRAVILGDLTGRMNIGGAEGRSVVILGDVVDADIDSSLPVHKMVVDSWTSTDADARSTLDAPSVGVLVSRGNLDADVTISAGVGTWAMGKVVSLGTIAGEWSMPGGVWAVVADRMADLTIDTESRLHVVRTGSLQGTLDADTIGTVVVTGNATDSYIYGRQDYQASWTVQRIIIGGLATRTAILSDGSVGLVRLGAADSLVVRAGQYLQANTRQADRAEVEADPFPGFADEAILGRLIITGLAGRNVWAEGLTVAAPQMTVLRIPRLSVTGRDSAIVAEYARVMVLMLLDGQDLRTSVHRNLDDPADSFSEGTLDVTLL